MRRWFITLALLALVAAGCAPLPPTPGAGGGISIDGAYARPAPAAGGNGAVFLTIENAGPAADRLVSASSAAAATVEIHETIDDGGVMKMRPLVDGIAIAGGESADLQPGGKHIMLIGLAAPLVAGQEIELALVFEKAGAITVKAPVRQ